MSALPERLEELLVDRATDGLTPAETLELEGFLQENPEVDEEGFDLAAAAIALAKVTEEALPAHLGASIESAVADAARQAPRELPVIPRWIPIAAILAFVIVGWLALRPSGPASVADQRDTLVATATDLVTLEWTSTEDPAASGAAGDVVWSDEAQQGFMRFRGLAANDPSVEQYQLWVFDSARDERYPVDGGVFDIPAGADEVIVPIDVKILVHEAALFAVTVEVPGGVVVSDRERIVVLAQL